MPPFLFHHPLRLPLPLSAQSHFQQLMICSITDFSPRPKSVTFPIGDLTVAHKVHRQKGTVYGGPCLFWRIRPVNLEDSGHPFCHSGTGPHYRFWPKATFGNLKCAYLSCYLYLAIIHACTTIYFTDFSPRPKWVTRKPRLRPGDSGPLLYLKSEPLDIEQGISNVEGKERF